MNKKVNLFVIGHPKSGTTAIHEFLSYNPEIFMSYPKDPIYFCDDIHKKSDNFHRKKKFFQIRKFDDYLKCFKGYKNQEYIGETSTFYFYSYNSAKNIYNYNPKAKILLIIREPISLMFSLHQELLNSNIEFEEDFSKALQLGKKRKLNLINIPKNVSIPDITFYFPFSFIYNPILRFYKYFSKNQIKIILFDDFKKDNKKVYLEILDFLEISNQYVPKFKKINSRHKIKFKFLNKFVKSKIVWSIPKTILPLEYYKKLKNRYLDFIRVPIKKEKLDPKLQKKLQSEFYEDIQKTSKLIGVDLIKKWGYDK